MDLSAESTTALKLGLGANVLLEITGRAPRKISNRMVWQMIEVNNVLLNLKFTTKKILCQTLRRKVERKPHCRFLFAQLHNVFLFSLQAFFCKHN